MISSNWSTLLLDVLFALVLFLSGVEAERDASKLHRFVTRPELKAPKWNVTIYDQEHVSPGYWFVAPYERIGQTEPGDGWIGPHIYDGHGELVWSGAHMFDNMSVMDFRISKYHGNNMISLIRPEERTGLIMDNQFNIVENEAIDGFNMHDFNFIENGARALVITRGVKNASEEDSRATGLENGLCEANFHGIEEIDTETWQPVWNWTSWGHIALEETTFKYGPATARCEAGGEWDFLHANAVDKCPDGDIILSGRHTDTIYKISREDGSIVWRLGGVLNDFEKGFNFSRQHDVRCRAQNETHTTISFLDNAKGEDPQTPSNPFSRGLLVALETETKQATIVAHYDHPHGDGGYAHRRGAFQVMDTANIFMCWSEHSLQSEHTPDGKMIMQANLQTEWLGTYRSYKFPFVGKPTTPPDVYAQAFNQPHNENATAMQIYASWNGATEVSSWKVYKTDKNGDAEVEISWIPKAGFETAISYEGFAKYIFVEAVDGEGNALGRSKTFETIPPLNILTPAVAEEELWQQKAADGGLSTTTDTNSEDETETDSEVDGYIYAFAGGFVLCAFLAFVIFGIWSVRHYGMSWPKKMPWHRQGESKQEYQPLAGKETVRITVEEC